MNIHWIKYVFKFRELASSVVGNRAKNLLLLWISLKTRDKKELVRHLITIASKI